MKDTTKRKLEAMFRAAEKSKKGDYSVYSSYKRQLEDLVLSPDEHTLAVIKMARILKI